LPNPGKCPTCPIHFAASQRSGSFQPVYGDVVKLKRSPPASYPPLDPDRLDHQILPLLTCRPISPAVERRCHQQPSVPPGFRLEHRLGECGICRVLREARLPIVSARDLAMPRPFRDGRRRSRPSLASLPKSDWRFRRNQARIRVSVWPAPAALDDAVGPSFAPLAYPCARRTTPLRSRPATNDAVPAWPAPLVPPRGNRCSSGKKAKFPKRREKPLKSPSPPAPISRACGQANASGAWPADWPQAERRRSENCRQQHEARVFCESTKKQNNNSSNVAPPGLNVTFGRPYAGGQKGAKARFYS